MLHARPGGRRTRLAVRPALASWERPSHPDQVKLKRSLEHVTELAQPAMDQDGPLALELFVGLTEGRLLTHDRDLDNYLYPVLNRLGHARFAAAFGSKRRQDDSTIAVGPTTPIAPRRSPDLVVSPTGTYEKREWILQIERACAHASPLDPYGNGPIRLVIAYDLGPSRNWTSLWKPTIDGLGPLLGTVIRPKKIHDDPRDGRITDLEFHQTVDPGRRHDLHVHFWWDIAPGRTTPAAL